MTELPAKRGGKRDNYKRRDDDKRGGYRGGARLKRRYELSEEAAQIVKEQAALTGMTKEDWLDRLIRGSNLQ